MATLVAQAQGRHTARFVIAPPMVASYAELAAVIDHVTPSGVRLASGRASAGRLGFGWEVETPAAALCTGLWADHLRQERGVTPAACGIGTNDLTQFTLARGRRSGPVGSIRPEAHPAVLALLARLAADCADRDVTAILSGAAAEDSSYRHFANSLGLLASCTPYALIEGASSGAVPILDQAVPADALPGAHGLPGVIVWRRSTPRGAAATEAAADHER
ncbi:MULTISPECIES: putative PEP-binding protein [unclassified Streptomyces]|uniref:putative PEP-binding protein n=1 Tax=unclassified Streptomyces TaxID=2593676 RepID=UPI00278BF189|nr:MULTISPECIES: putative PEP-binding protein [unclassified Streptomyces]